MSNDDVLDAREFMVIKSDQMNYEDFIAGPKSYKIVRLGRKLEKGEPRLMVYLEGREKTPWIPSKGMVKCMSAPAGWGDSLKDWIGRSVRLFGEPTVVFGGKELGGIRVSHLSHIEADYITKITERRGVRIDYLIQKMEPVQAGMYPVERFDKALPVMMELIVNGKMTAEQVIAQCEQTGLLTDEQKKRITQPQQEQ